MPVRIDIDPNANPLLDAARLSHRRDVLPSALSSREQRAVYAQAIREGAVFSARTTNAHYLQKVREVVTAVLNGDMDRAQARLVLTWTLDALGYTPEGGFPLEGEGKKDKGESVVPPAVEGTIEDLRSRRRLDLMIDTQIALARGRGQRDAGMRDADFYSFPGWELVRVAQRAEPRDWEERWQSIGGALYEGRMIAFKNDPIWEEVGSSLNFDDALDVGYPPFAFNSGMGWRGVSREEVERLGVTLVDAHLVDAGGTPTLPSDEYTLEDIAPAKPVASTHGLDDDFIAELKRDLKADQDKNGRLTMDDIIRRSAERSNQDYERRNP